MRVVFYIAIACGILGALIALSIGSYLWVGINTLLVIINYRNLRRYEEGESHRQALLHFLKQTQDFQELSRQHKIDELYGSNTTQSPKNNSEES